jgi:hypothetical protein
MSLITANKVKKKHTSQGIVKKKRTKPTKEFEKFKLFMVLLVFLIRYDRLSMNNLGCSL